MLWCPLKRAHVWFRGEVPRPLGVCNHSSVEGVWGFVALSRTVEAETWKHGTGKYVLWFTGIGTSSAPHEAGGRLACNHIMRLRSLAVLAARHGQSPKESSQHAADIDRASPLPQPGGLQPGERQQPNYSLPTELRAARRGECDIIPAADPSLHVRSIRRR